MKATIKEVLLSEKWIVNEIMQGLKGKIRVSAATRHHVADGQNFFCEWCTKKYANQFTIDRYGKKVNELKSYKY